MDNRKHPRFDSGNLLSYVCLDNQNKIIQQGMGKTIDVSEGGILLETHVSINPDYTILLSIGLEDEMADIKGNVIYSRKRNDGMIESGIRFDNVTKDCNGILLSFIKKFHL
ncbi:MAG: PilZ domain-containing protein [Desulfobacteraceae bacterium]|jgi:hypothetical protein